MIRTRTDLERILALRRDKYSGTLEDAIQKRADVLAPYVNEIFGSKASPKDIIVWDTLPKGAAAVTSFPGRIIAFSSKAVRKENEMALDMTVAHELAHIHMYDYKMNLINVAKHSSIAESHLRQLDNIEVIEEGIATLVGAYAAHKVRNIELPLEKLESKLVGYSFILDWRIPSVLSFSKNRRGMPILNSVHINSDKTLSSVGSLLVASSIDSAFAGTGVGTDEVSSYLSRVMNSETALLDYIANSDQERVYALYNALRRNSTGTRVFKDMTLLGNAVVIGSFIANNLSAISGVDDKLAYLSSIAFLSSSLAGYILSWLRLSHRVKGL